MKLDNVVLTPHIGYVSSDSYRVYFNDIVEDIIAFLAGACIVAVISLYSSLVQLMISDAMRGRVMSIFMLAFRGGMPLGNLVAGYVAQRWSISLALAVNGAILAAVALIFIIKRTDLDAQLAPA